MLGALEPRRLFSAAGTGLLATYYNNPTFTGTSVTRIDRTVSFDFGRGSPSPKIAPDTFSARWTGRLKAAFSEQYIFDVPVNDGVRLWVNHRLLIDRWNNQGASDHSGTIQLRAGKRYDIQLEYRERTGDASVALRWSSPSTQKQLVPRRRLYPAAQNLRSKIDHAFGFAAQQLVATMKAQPDDTAYPSISAADGSWKTVDLHSWDAGYFGGALWQMYARSGDRRWVNLATRWTRSLATARNDGDDLGSRFMTTYRPLIAATGQASDRQALLDAAMSKLSTFDNTVGMFRTVHARASTSGNPRADFPVLIDQTMDLALVYDAAQRQNRGDWADKASRHLAKLETTLVRPDGSTYQWGYFDESNGKFVSGETRQGLSNGSTWSRGQAWAIYSFVTGYAYTRRGDFLATAKKLIDYFLAHSPSDHVPYWDFAAPGSRKTPRDSSAAAIVASALIKLASPLRPSTADAAHYRAAAEAILSSLLSPRYQAEGTSSRGILRHGARYVARGERDNSLIFGDYYLLEAMNGAAAL